MESEEHIMNQKEKIEEIIIECFRELNETLNVEELTNPDRETRLYGAKSGLDSLSLVSLIADVEERIIDEFAVTVLLADERAMSQRTSPFRKVGTLTDYVDALIEETKAE